MRDKKKRKLTEGDGFSLSQTGPLGISLGALLGAEGGEKRDKAEGDDKAPEKSLPKAEPEKEAAEAKISKVSLRRERAGRGGRTVTIVTLPRDYRGDLTALAKELRKALGCGSAIEDEKIVLQGDIMERVEGWFAKKGVTRVTKSG
ncbi:MAG: hypothetical protein Q4D58_06685 [Synergistaceae bacterium]|nr:hypothetical protein [Synergistaceae bacterium]